MNKKSYFLVLICALFVSHLYSQDIAGYFNIQDNETTFHQVYQLSDGTFLITGTTSGDFSSLGITPTELDTSSTIPFFSQTDKVTSFQDFFSFNDNGFIIHLSKDYQDILNVIKFPDGVALTIQKIRTTNIPGKKTGDMYISGQSRTGGTKGYFITKLDHNFVDGIPMQCEWFRFVESDFVDNYGCFQSKPSYHRTHQPWDVDSEGNIFYVEEPDFSSSDWVKLFKLQPNGTKTSYEHAIYHRIFKKYDKYPHDGKDSSYLTHKQIYTPVKNDSATFELTYKDINGNDSTVNIYTRIDSMFSFIMFKQTGTTGRTLRSLVKEDYDHERLDENGNLRVTGKYPYDYLYAYPFDDTANFPNNRKSMEGPGKLGHGPSVGVSAMFNGRVNDITIDKRNGNVYFAYTHVLKNSSIPQGFYEHFSDCPNSSALQVESAVVSMKGNGKLRWWARAHKDDSVNTSMAAQFINELEIDYSNNDLLVLGKGFNTSPVNFWKGDSIESNEGAPGFKHEITGSKNKISYGWLGRYDLDTLLIKNATYIAEYDSAFTPTGTPLQEPLLKGWRNPNEGDPDLGQTVCHNLHVDSSGNVYVACEGERTITTRNAYQYMPQADRDQTYDSLPTSNAFVRKYAPDLSDVLYSSLITGEWNKSTGTGGDNTSISSVWSANDHILAIGDHKGTGEDIPGYFIPEWGMNNFDGISAIFTKLETKHKLNIKSYPKIVSGGNSYDITFTVPKSLDFSDTNEFVMLLSGNQQTFNAITELGRVSGDSSGTLTINISDSISPGNYKMMLMSTEDSIYSRAVNVSVTTEICGFELGKPKGDTLLCAGDTTKYTVNNVCVPMAQWSVIPSSAKNYIEVMNDTTAKIYWDNAAYKEVSVTTYTIGKNQQNNDTAIYADTLSVTLNKPNPEILIDTINHSLTARPNGPDYTFQWYRQGDVLIPNATDSTYNADYCDKGDVKNYVVITDPYGCTETSNYRKAYNQPPDCEQNIEELFAGNAINIYPNPAKEHIFIEMNKGLPEPVHIKLYDLLGNTIFQQQEKAPLSLKIPVKNLTGGIYILEFVSGQDRNSYKMTIE